MPETLVQTSKIVELLECNLETRSLLTGTLLKWMDIIACLAAEKHANAPCVTASVDDLQFEKIVSLGQVITLKAWINRAFNTSMEVEVLVNSEDTTNMDTSIICKAFFTFVTQPGENGKKNFLKPIEPLTEEEKAQFLLANERKKMRLDYRSSLRKMKEDDATDDEEMTTFEDKTEDFISPSSTFCESVEIVLPQHANHHSTTFGGQLMAWMEATSTISARRLCRSQPRLIAVDEVFFRAPSNVGDRVLIRSRVNNTFYRSLEVGVRVEAYAVGGKRRHIQSAYFSYIAPDEEGHPKQLPIMRAANKDDQSRMVRSEVRFRMRQERRAILSSTSPLTAVCPTKNESEVDVPEEPEDTKVQQRASVLSFNVSTAVSLTKDNEKILCYRNILALMELYDTSSFQLTIQMETFKIFQREIDGGLCIRIEMEIELPASTVYKVLSDHVSRKLWDMAIKECTIEQEICKNEDYVVRIVMANPLRENIKGDDFVLLASNRQDSSGTYTIAYRSVVVDSIPPVPEYHRTENRCSGFILEDNKSAVGGCKITYINQVTDRVYEYFRNDLRGATDTLKQKEVLMMSYIRQRASSLTEEYGV